MATKLSEQEKRKRTCGSKTQFESEDDALKYGDKINEEFTQDTIWDAYKCPYCNMWHISKRWV